MSKDTFYFSHDYNARSDVKVKKLIIKHGYEGYGLYWALIEDLYQNGNVMPLDYDFIAYDMRTSSEVVRSIINDFDLFEVDDDTFGSLSIQRRLDKRNVKSRKARQSAMKRWGDDDNKVQNNANALQTHCDNNANALSVECYGNTDAMQHEMRHEINRNAIKERKGKESKVKDNKGKDREDTNVSLSDAEHPTQEKIDYKAVIDFFNEETQGVFGKVLYPISKKREESIRARINEFGKDAFAEMIRKASKSDFLKGDGNKGFIAKFDWMIRPSNFQKIIEGNYDNRNKRHSSGAAASDEELMLHIKQGIARGIQENAI